MRHATWTLIGLLGVAQAFYLPYLAPTNYAKGDSVPVLVNRLTGFNDDRESIVFGYDYYTEAFHFCKPADFHSEASSLGSILFGDRIYTSPFEVKMLEDVDCRYLCTAGYSDEDVKFTADLLGKGLLHRWLIDGLPITSQLLHTADKGDFYYAMGFLAGHPAVTNENYMEKEIFLFNHFDFFVDYHETADGQFRVVGASVEPRSIQTSTQVSKESDFQCPVGGAEAPFYHPGPGEGAQLSFSYSVKWKKSLTPWATRWDKYLKLQSGTELNWFALINTILFVVVTTFVTWMTLLRFVRKDIARYNEIDLASDDINEDLGWKLVHGDVFRPPQHRFLYAILLGSGAQIFVTVLSTLALALVGLLSPANRGAFSTALLVLNALNGGVGGYVSGYIYKSWGGEKLKANLLLTPLVVPSLVFLMFLFINFLFIASKASGAVPVGSIAAVITIWGMISVPLSIIFGIYGVRQGNYTPPTRVNQIPRQIPKQPVKFRLLAMMACGGLFPFLAMALQLFYILSAVWLQRIFYMFGFLFFSVLAAVILCISMTLLSVYFMLCSENYNWQWRSFFIAGSPAVYILIYSFACMAGMLHISSFAGKLVFVCYSFVASALAFLAFGSVGALASYALVHRIYSSIKIE